MYNFLSTTRNLFWTQKQGKSCVLLSVNPSYPTDWENSLYHGVCSATVQKWLLWDRGRGLQIEIKICHSFRISEKTEKESFRHWLLHFLILLGLTAHYLPKKQSKFSERDKGIKFWTGRERIHRELLYSFESMNS